MGSAQVDHIRPIIGHPGDFGAIKRAIGANTRHVNVVVAVVENVPGIVQSLLVIAEKAHGVEALALVVTASDGGELSESVSVVFGHESNIQDLRAHGGFGGQSGHWPGGLAQGALAGATKGRANRTIVY